MIDRLPDYNLSDREEIKAEGPIMGGMQSPRVPSEPEAEGEVEDEESEPEAENDQVGFYILTDETLPQTAANREAAALSTAQRLVMEEEYRITLAAHEVGAQQGTANEEAAEAAAALHAERRQATLEEHQTYTESLEERAAA